MMTAILTAIALTLAAPAQPYEYHPKGAPMLRQAPVGAELTARMRAAVSERDTAAKLQALPAGCRRRALLQGSGSVIECG